VIRTKRNHVWLVVLGVLTPRDYVVYLDKRVPTDGISKVSFLS
jgi:hypothetical protein